MIQLPIILILMKPGVIGGATSTTDAVANKLIPDKISAECSLVSGKTSGPCSSDYAIAAMGKLTGDKIKDITPEVKEQIVEKAKTVLSCDSERCVVSHNKFKRVAGAAVADAEIKTNFKIRGPTDTKWLNNNNIDETMQQWARLIPDAKFYPYNFNMRNFKEKGDTLATIDIYDLYKAGYRTLGCVINSDKYSGRGQHWMALFGDMRTNNFTFEFFNSSGNQPQVEFAEWLLQTKSRAQDIIKEENIINGTAEIIKCCEKEHQLSKTECGVYSLYYIYTRLNNVPARHFLENEINDVLCFEFRQHLFHDDSRAPMTNFDFKAFAGTTRVEWEEDADNTIVKRITGGDTSNGDTSNRDTSTPREHTIYTTIRADLHHHIKTNQKHMDIRVNKGKWRKMTKSSVVVYNDDLRCYIKHITVISPGKDAPKKFVKMIKCNVENLFPSLSPLAAITYINEMITPADIVSHGFVLFRYFNEIKTSDEVLAMMYPNDKELAETKINVPFSLRYCDHTRRLPYRERVNSTRMSLHWGQRKLLLTEIMFLTEYIKLENPTVVYAGAAPGIHLSYLVRLFPTMQFELYDSRDFVVEAGPRVRLHQTFFTDDIAREYAGKPNVLFISDIRTGDCDSTEEPFEESVIADMDAQARWHKIMSPVASMVKFRLPYGTNIDVEYCKGDIYIQPWAASTSTETRLIITGDTTCKYNSMEYEERMFRFNLITRVWSPYKCDEYLHGEGLDHCWDCRAEVEILRNYIAAVKQNTPIATFAPLITTMSREISRALSSKSTLIQPPHGVMKAMSMENKYTQLYNRFADVILQNNEQRQQKKKNL